MSKTDGPVICQQINNFRFLVSFPREYIEFALNYKPENDKFIVLSKIWHNLDSTNYLPYN